MIVLFLFAVALMGDVLANTIAHPLFVLGLLALSTAVTFGLSGLTVADLRARGPPHRAAARARGGLPQHRPDAGRGRRRGARAGLALRRAAPDSDLCPAADHQAAGAPAFHRSLKRRCPPFRPRVTSKGNREALMPRPLRIAPSILASDFSKLAEEVRAVEAAGADWIHLDVMDGHFVPVITLRAGRGEGAAPDHPEDARRASDDRPGRSASRSLRQGRRRHHHRPCRGRPHLHRSLQAIRALGKKAGVTMNPGTPVESIEHVIDMVDLVLVMSVNPGCGGQKFIPAAEEKIRRVAALVGGRPIDIEVDGGVTAGKRRARHARRRQRAGRGLGGVQGRRRRLSRQHRRRSATPPRSPVARRRDRD